MRHQDNSIRLRAHGLGFLALVSAAALVHAYIGGDLPLGWWLVFGGALAVSVHFYRRSRK